MSIKSSNTQIDKFKLEYESIWYITCKKGIGIEQNIITHSFLLPCSIWDKPAPLILKVQSNVHYTIFKFVVETLSSIKMEIRWWTLKFKFSDRSPSLSNYLQNVYTILKTSAMYCRSNDICKYVTTWKQILELYLWESFNYLVHFADILVLGVGDTTDSSRINKKIPSFMVKRRINIEVLPTEQACATFNFLNAESRYIAGALLPPLSLRPSEEDILLTKLKHRKLLIAQDD